MKNLFSIVIALFLFSCAKQVEKVESTYDNGSPKVVGYYEKEVRVGEVQYHKNGKVKMEGSLKNGERDGIWKAYHENGKLWTEGLYENGMRQGQVKNYYVDGALRYEGQFKNDKKVGLWKFYDTKGNLSTSKEF